LALLKHVFRLMFPRLLRVDILPNLEKRERRISMITLSNGHAFEYMVASGALAFDGRGWPWERPLVWAGLIEPQLFTTVIKTLTRRPRAGNLRWWRPWSSVRLIPGGAVNKIGLTNPGIDWWCRHVGPKVRIGRQALVGSIFGDLNELVEMAEMLNRYDLVALEVNPSCPNTGHDLQTAETTIASVRAVHEISRFPIIVKVSVDQKYLEIARGLEGTAEAVALNSVPYKTVFPYKLRGPLHRLEAQVGGGGGGVSGRPAQKHNWAAVEALARRGSLPVIGPSVMKYSDLAEIRRLGASAISFGAIHLRTPWAPTSIVRKDMNHAKR
jgi:dihydroorotate dehydrogenase